MNPNAGVPARGGVLESIKQSLKMDSWMDKIRESKNILIDVAVYLGIGFLVGFLFKRFSKFLIVFLVFVGVLIVMQQMELISIAVNTEKMYSMFGMQPGVGGETPTAMTFEWVKANIVITISFAIGFLLGLRVG